MRLIIGNKAYSSWSLRGWLACQLSGLPFEERVVDLHGAGWDNRRLDPELAPGDGKVPILWQNDQAVWDSLAIIDHLDRATGGTRFWPDDPIAFAFARSISAEMHAGFPDLREACSMNLRRVYPPSPVGDAVARDVDRIVHLWRTARKRFGVEGQFLFGHFGAADAMYAPVVARMVTYALPVPDDTRAYVDAVIAHPWLRRWTEEAMADPHMIAKYER